MIQILPQVTTKYSLDYYETDPIFFLAGEKSFEMKREVLPPGCVEERSGW